MFQRIGQAAFKKDLSNTLALCKQLGNPQQAFPSIHIAGTNGKGSSAHSLAAVLQTAGFKTGLYTSPHLKEFTERIRINGQEIKQEAVVTFVTENQTFLEELQPSFFETTVAMAFDYFRQEEVDIAIIEVGMGGRLDSTNVINPLVSLITHIGYDHMEFLGDSLDKIAAEKAGIVKEGVPVVIGERQADTEKVFVETARAQKSAIYFAQDRYQAKVNQVVNGKYTVDIARYGQLLYTAVKLSLGSHYQLKNLPGILMVLDLINEMGYAVTESDIREGLAHVTQLTGLKGRWQVIRQQPLTICDTGHNQGAMREIVKQLEALSYRRLFVVLGFSAEKDLSSILPLLPKDAYYLFCSAAIPRAMPAPTLAANAQEYDLNGEVLSTVGTAYDRAQALAEPDDCIFVGGSTFVVAEIEDL